MFYSESVGCTTVDGAVQRRLAQARTAISDVRWTLSLAQLRLLAAHHYAICDGGAPRLHRPRGARRVSAQTLRWHQQMRRLDARMLGPVRPAPLRIAWSLTRALADAWVRWIARSATATSRAITVQGTT